MAIIESMQTITPERHSAYEKARFPQAQYTVIDSSTIYLAYINRSSQPYSPQQSLNNMYIPQGYNTCTDVGSSFETVCYSREIILQQQDM
jgi:hypothetical protein